jgi:hypothetical protein
MRTFPYLASNALGGELIVLKRASKNIHADGELSVAAYGVSAWIASCEEIVIKGAEVQIFPGGKIGGACSKYSSSTKVKKSQSWNVISPTLSWIN